MLGYQIIPVTSFQQNCSLVWCDQTSEAVLIDPGGDMELLLAAIESQRLKLTAIWLTHGHLDHIGATAELVKQFEIPVIGPHKDDLFLFQAIPMQVEMFAFPSVEKFIPDQWLDETQILKLGNEQFSILHTPGHTPGHIVFKYEPQKLLWVGDVLFQGGIGRTDFPRGDYNQLIASIKDKLMSLDDNYQFIPGHGPESSIGNERMNNPFLQSP